jgi:predicted NBD/HSP70 family sugar kinase
MDLPERLKEVQTLAERGDGQARRIFETIGVYLGYTIPYYAEYYDFSHLLILGRVISGAGGDIILAKARAILKKEFPELTRTVGVHVPDEKSRRVGQAVAAASLPELN